MKLSRDIESFIKDFVKDLSERNVAVFVGAGMSQSQGFVNWTELLREIADDLGLSVDKEYDLLSITQYHANENTGRAKLNRKILEEFSDLPAPAENHKILARLPITTFWTTNYDKLVEDALRQANKVPDVKHEVKQLANTRPKRDAVVYKMHGDVDHSADAILTKHQYEAYYKTHEPFITALSGDLISKTFLFIGFSFSDPNLNYVLGRLNLQFGENNRQHYCFIKKETKGKDDDDEILQYKLRKQRLMVDDLKRYKIKALLIDTYEDITEILKEVERRYKKKSIFISGSAEEYGAWNTFEAQKFIHLLSKGIVLSDFNVVNGFGWGVGSAVINGALEAVSERPDKYSEEQLIMRPFPQFETGEKTLSELWREYRQKMISLAAIAVFIFGNKKDSKTGDITLADGVKKEFDIAVQQGVIPIPIASTGYTTKEIYKEILKSPERFYGDNQWIVPLIEELADENLSFDDIIGKVINIIKKINK